MTAKEIQEIIEREVAGQWSRTNAHRCDLRRCLVAPVRCRFEDTTPMKRGVIEMWLVLEEDPVEGKGYKIVYDDHTGDFGLACPGIEGHDIYLGPYGSFCTTFEAM